MLIMHKVCKYPNTFQLNFDDVTLFEKNWWFPCESYSSGCSGDYDISGF